MKNVSLIKLKKIIYRFKNFFFNKKFYFRRLKFNIHNFSFVNLNFKKLKFNQIKRNKSNFRKIKKKKLKKIFLNKLNLKKVKLKKKILNIQLNIFLLKKKFNLLKKKNNYFDCFKIIKSYKKKLIFKPNLISLILFYKKVKKNSVINLQNYLLYYYKFLKYLQFF